MAERNLLNNGRFLRNLSNWTASNAEYSAGDGDDHYGVAVLSTGCGYIQQVFSVPRVRLYSIHLAVKAVGADLSESQCQLVITDENGNIVLTENLTGTADTWTDNDISVGLATGATYTAKIINNTALGNVKIDDTWIWFVPLTRVVMAARIHAKLGRLATERSLSTTVSGLLTEGSYTYAVDAGMRSVGAINSETGLPDTRYLDESNIQIALDTIEKEMIEQLQRDFAVETDIRIGQRSESRSQIAKALGEMKNGSSGGSGPVVVRRLIRNSPEDFEL